MPTKAYYQKNKDKIRKYRKDNADKVRAWKKKYRDKNKEMCKKYYTENKIRIKDSQKKNYHKLRVEAIKHYSKETMKCGACPINDIDVLVLDHIHGGGSEDRKNNRGSGASLYRALRNENYPPEFQVLCRNCNWKKEIKQRYRSSI